jgi:hypothetical protein
VLMNGKLAGGLRPGERSRSASSVVGRRNEFSSKRHFFTFPPKSKKTTQELFNFPPKKQENYSRTF